MIDLDKFVEDCLRIREQSPLVHNITNYVAMNVAANALLSAGASPIMSFCPEEMEDLAWTSKAVVINTGCLDRQLVEAMKKSASAALRYDRPVVFDPVGAGASAYRLEVCLEFMQDYHPGIIRCNASEASALCSLDGPFGSESKGVDAFIDSSEALPFAVSLAKESGAVVSMSGPVDYVTDGVRVETLRNGDPIMGKVTAMGCVASALTGAFAAVDDDLFDASLNAMALMGVAGQMAARKAKGATGTFACCFLDVLSTFNPGEIAKKIRQ